jgi:hypothetical protein
MTDNVQREPRARDQARALELTIRAAVAEERLLGARLARVAEGQRRTRADIAREQLREHFGQPPDDWVSPATSDAPSSR